MKKPINFLAAVSLLLICGCVGWYAMTASVGGPPPVEAGPTAVPQPSPPFAEIRQNYGSMTEAQWESFADSLKGKHIAAWSGPVKDVDQALGEYAVKIAIDGENDNQVTVPVPEDLALSIDRGQTVTATGEIFSVFWVLDLVDLTLKEGATLQVD